MCKECATYVPVDILLVSSGLGGSFSCVKDFARDNIQEIISLGRGLIRNDAAVCGGRMGLKILVRDSSEM